MRKTLLIALNTLMMLSFATAAFAADGDAAGKPEQGPLIQAHRAAPRRQCGRAGAEDQVVHDPAGYRHPGSRVLHRHHHPDDGAVRHTGRNR